MLMAMSIPNNTIYTEEEAYALNKSEQCKLLKERGVKFSISNKEATMVKKILNSNPKEEKLASTLCEKCGSKMIITGGGPSGTDYHCPKCKANITR